ncbi:MAG: SDR family oxidoreductase [Nocardioidaceae bacterium]
MNTITDQRLLGKVAIVTGAGRGIGQATALKLAREGAHVIVNDLDSVAVDETVAAIGEHGGSALGFAANATDADFGEKIVASAVDTYGELDIIVNNAGYTWDTVIQKMTDEQWDAIIDIHLRTPFRLLRAAQPFIAKRAKAEIAAGNPITRKVVNISSVSGLGGNAGQANYSTAKAGIVGFTKTMAKEWGRYNVTVNAVAFGMISTRLNQAVEVGVTKTINVAGNEVKVGIPQASSDAFMARVPLGRAGTVEEGAGAVYLFCAPESSYISGEILVCGGGFLM